MCTKNYRVYGWKTQTEITNWWRVYLYHELIGEADFNSVFLFVLNFLISGKVTSLPKVIKYVKEVNILSMISVQNIRQVLL